ncbi:hypothetical protein C8R44DRAFT_878049 [Mycena epipterygia]|nr:hypothetical protein C8R44DRAFT_878049 [Mycena epipterygia]
MPISSNSNSSFEFGETSKPAEHRRFSIHSGKTGASPNASSARSKRESHMTNLPLVEAQLLPSLRDTIDRMTRAPSRIFAPPSSPPDDGIYRSVARRRFLAWYFATSAFDTKTIEVSSACTNAKITAQIAALPRACCRNLCATSFGIWEQCSGPNNKSGVQTPLTPTRSRQRSRTDPGVPLQAPQDSDTPANPIPNSDARSRMKASSAVSNIPRPRPTTGLRSASSTPRPRHENAGDDSASDLELRYEQEARDRRSLRVVNAVMSSESESDGEPQSRAGVGLGLGLAAPYTSRSFASKLRARFTGNSTGGGDEAAERRRKELLGLVKGLDKFGSQLQGQPQHGHDSDHEYGVVVSGSGRVDFGVEAAQAEPPRVMVSSSSGTNGELERDAGYIRREQERSDRPTSIWKRGRSSSPAPPIPPQQEDSRGRKSPSRSPVVRPSRPASQAAERDDLMPDALRRHSVYHHSTPPRPISSAGAPSASFADEEHGLLTRSPESVYGEPDNEQWPEERHHMQDPSANHLQPRDPRQSRLQRHSEDLANSDTVLLSLHSRLAAARDREALGLPPSASNARCAGDGGGERMSYLDSGSSLARIGRAWENGDRRGSDREGRNLSFGAEKLFRTLSGRTVEGGEREAWSSDPGYAFGQDDILKGRAMDAARPVSLSFSQSSSASSMYEDEDYEDVQELERTEEAWQGGEMPREAEEERSEGKEETLPDEPAEEAWRCTLPPVTYAAIATRYGSLEIRRQEAIHTLCVTEESFVARLLNTINLFVLPLRMHDSKSYISGVPAEIAKLFDWLEDILNLHTQLLSALQCAREAQHPVVERVAEAIRGSFVKRLEVYQPYLARLVSVAGTIARLVADTTSDFGEFVRLQEDVRECRGWSLESLLVDPVTRLGMYPAMFRKLHEYTPKVHADYIPTFALLHSTEMVIKVMTEVKDREDEYDLVKSLAQRIKGLPASVLLARRGRRLLFQGQLLRVRTDPQQHESLGAQVPVDGSTLFDDRRKSRSSDPPKRSINLVNVIREWDQRRERSGSVKSNGSSSTAASFNSYGTNSSAASSEPPLTTIIASFFISILYSATQIKADPQSGETQLVQVFVFTDFVLVAAVCKSRYSGTEEWTLLDNFGIAKVLGVAELSGETNNASPLLALDVLPLDIKNLGEGVVSESVSLEVLHLRVPALDLSSNKEEVHRTWFAAFQQSFKLTLRAISIPGGYLVAAQSNNDPDYDGPQQLPMSQRPLPKSPSLIAEIHGESSSPQRQEREERGWWSWRFRRVLGEFQSREASS